MFLFLLSILSAYDGTGGIFGRAEPLCPESCKCPLKRTLFGITWSCLSTIVLCAWTSVHPNVPPRSKWQARWNRLKLMFWMIVAPELVLAWAVRQLYAAKDIRDMYNKRKGAKEWTLSHGHFLSMGGYTRVKDWDGKGRLRKPREPGFLSNPADWERYYELENHYRRSQLGTLTVEHFTELIEDSDFEFPDTTEADIQDRSKGDALFKVIAILQTTHFIVQCIARGQQKLALTELELVTLALASLNAMTFGIWWYKPLGVEEPVKIYVKSEARKVEDAAQQEDRMSDLSFSDVIRKGWKFIEEDASSIPDFLRNPCKRGPIGALLQLFIGIPIAVTYIISFPFFVLFPLGIILLLRIIKAKPVRLSQESPQLPGLLAARIVASLQSFRYRLSTAVGNFFGRWLKDIFRAMRHFLFGWFILLPSLFVLLFLFTAFLTPFLALLFLISFIFTAAFGIVTTSTIDPGASHVPSFYAPVTKSDRWSRMVVFALFGVIFGGLHCIGWYFKYPTRSEQTLWRATSLAITVIPLIVAPIDFLLATRLQNRDIKSCQKFERRALLTLDFIMTIFLFAYVPARLSLIAQALALLRNQPSSALVAVDLTKYVIHLFS